MIDYILTPQSIEALGWTLLHSLWQGAIFAIVLVLILIALRKYTAQSRYVVSVGILCAFFMTVSATFWKQWNVADNRMEVEALSSSENLDDVFVSSNHYGEVVKTIDERGKSLLSNSEESIKDQSNWVATFRDYYQGHLPLLVTIWFLGVLFLQLRFLGQLAYVQRLKHYGTQLFPTVWSDKIEELEGKLRIQKKVKYLTSMRIESPMVIGWLKPVILIPQQLFHSLSETEIYAVLAHELAHIRREDFIINLLQSFLCNVFFFHPGVWWMSHRIDDEREHCCDDLAVSATGPATSYAKTLINVSELQLRIQETPALAVALSGKQKRRDHGGFSNRIHRLFMVGNVAGTFREGFATACILIMALFLGLVATGRTVQAKDLSLISENIQSENTFENESLEESEINNKITKATPVSADLEDKTLSIKSLNQSELPIAIPDKEEAYEEIEAQADFLIRDTDIETRIDALVVACEEGDFDFVKTLVKSGIDVNGIGSEGFTPLMMATSHNEAEIVKYLLGQGADVNQTFNGWNALIEAADEGSLSSMKHLLNAGAEVNYYSNIGSPTAINMAASEGKLDCLKLLLENGADINGVGKSIPPLHIAAEEDKRDIIDYLISQKVNINKKDAGGRTALMYAASEGQEFSVLKLVEAGADISIVDLYGATAKDYALEEEEKDIVNYLTDNTKDIHGTKPEIHQATLDGHIEKVQRMVEEGTDVNTRDDYGRTALHLASALNHNIDMRVLINLGADINAQDKQDRTPLMYAAADGQAGAATLLVSYQANVELSDVDGMRAFEWAQSGGNTELVNFLGLITKNRMRIDTRINTNRNGGKTQEKNAQIETKITQKQNQNIERARQKKENNRQKEEAKRRNENGAQRDAYGDSNIDRHTDNHTDNHTDIHTHIDDEKDIGKRETLHVTKDGYHLRQFDIEEKIPELLEATRHGTIEDLSKLLNNGLTVNDADDTGQTPLMVAAMTNRLDVATYLINKGADVNQSSMSGLTALHYTALENYDQMAQLLLRNKAQVDATMRYSSTDGNYSEEPIVWEYVGATPLLIAVESGNVEVLSTLINAGANTNHTLMKKEYRLNKDRVSYLSGSEVMGLDEDFLEGATIIIKDNRWTPNKQALLLSDPEILALFPKK